ncbi:MAG: PpiC-type peptidyl-prolyl cis-trans isomerase [Candidatus Tokpelaia hoelldobleri]|uniref:Parvulin-like PPIase n=1 Tax=Candidatus Tokpelaia hoelldobleri TaxID=1902579 RepID=A0A1U9JV46_9HYPH|nr:MAG: PpiC-type peptidyl-prolyl cis-trans isomerase [Candidatus Tokpelaia hoelldoblerii]
MVTVYKNAEEAKSSAYPMKEDVDTRVPPRAAPIMDEIRVNGVVIAEADLLLEAQNHPAETAQAALFQAARALVVRELLWQEAQRLGHAQADTDNAGQTPVDTAIEQLIEHQVTPPQATEEECRRVYECDPQRFTSGTLVEARHILLAADPKDLQAREKAQETARAILRELESDMSRFATLAQEFSACSSSRQGGNLGQLSAGSTVPEFEKALNAAPATGLLKAPVETRYGYHIVNIVRKVDGSLLPFDIVHERIAAWLEAASWSRAVAQYISLLTAEADIKGFNIMPHDGSLVQ